MKDLKDILFEAHTHAELVNMGNPDTVVYTEERVVKIIEEFYANIKGIYNTQGPKATREYIDIQLIKAKEYLQS